MRLAVLGVGLIGGSVGLAARERAGADVVGWDPVPAPCRARHARSAPSRPAAPSVGEAVAGADGRRRRRAGRRPARGGRPTRSPPRARTPRSPTSARPSARSSPPTPTTRRFVGGHPLAGAETAGVEHARADLFDGATWYLTPTDGTSGVLYERLHRLLAAPRRAAPRDRRRPPRPRSWPPSPTSRTCSPTCSSPGAPARWPRAASGSPPPARASATPPAWPGPTRRDLDATSTCPTRDALVDRIDDAIAPPRGGARARWPTATATPSPPGTTPPPRTAAGCSRPAWPAGPVHELRASVPNEPGVVAQLALELGRAGVNITDMALYPAADIAHGVGRAVDRGRRAGRRAPRSSSPRWASRWRAHEPARSTPPARCAGSSRPPADKSISHRAALLGAMSAEPVRDHATTSTPRTPTRRWPRCAQLGAIVEDATTSCVDPRRRACATRSSRRSAIDVGNCGHADAAAARVAGPAPGHAGRFDGDESIRRRPVDRIAEPLRAHGRADRGPRRPLPAVHRPRARGSRHRVRAARRLAPRSSPACCSRAWPGEPRR